MVHVFHRWRALLSYVVSYLVAFVVCKASDMTADEQLAVNVNLAFFGVQGLAVLCALLSVRKLLQDKERLSNWQIEVELALEAYALDMWGPWMYFYAVHCLGIVTIRALEAPYEEEMRVAAGLELNHTTPWRNWDLAGSSYFCWQLFTTVGYGTFAPETGSGKVFTIVFAIFAPILFGVLVRVTGSAFIRFTTGWLLRSTGRRLRAHLEQLINASQTRDHEASSSAGPSAAPPGPQGADSAEPPAGMVSKPDRNDQCTVAGVERVFTGPQLRAPCLVRKRVVEMVSAIDDGDGLLTQYEVAKLIDAVIEHRDSNVAFLSSLFWAFLLVFAIPFAIPPKVGWGRLDAVYYMVVTSTTVGLGDFVLSVPGSDGDGVTSLRFPFVLPGSPCGVPTNFSKWAAYLDPLFQFYFVVVFTLFGAVLGSAYDMITFDLVKTFASTTRYVSRDLKRRAASTKYIGAKVADVQETVTQTVVGAHVRIKSTLSSSSPLRR